MNDFDLDWRGGAPACSGGRGLESEAKHARSRAIRDKLTGSDNDKAFEGAKVCLEDPTSALETTGLTRRFDAFVAVDHVTLTIKEVWQVLRARRS